MVRQVLLCGYLALSCTPKPPPEWQGGGARLQLVDATWTRRGNVAPVVLHRDGRVEAPGWTFHLDVVGRVSDEYFEPLALLYHEGELLGTGSRPMGYVGWNNAAPAGSDYAWLRVEDDGRVHLYGDGERLDDGRWTGCGKALRTCTLVTHLVALHQARRPRRRPPPVGFGWYWW